MSFFLRVRITQTKKKNETIIDNHRSTSFLDGYENKNGYEFHWNPKYMFYKKNTKAFGFMSGSCHLDRASNVEIGVECQIFVIVIFFNCSRVLQFGAHSRYYKGALTQKRSFLVICTTFRSDFHVG